ncbi:hypothetical protein [Bradyrhizobium monzae]|uniref:hypothetical protein n=1 Tax=Bradyrhizobium sp. Oc8 TaxID=2876780 RepID=UPI001F33E454|nr:hypothetical protein [Bradyrhizobium sp. Oc8]
MNEWKTFEHEVAEAIRANGIIFLRRAATEMAGHDDSEDTAFDHETGTVVTVLTQMSLELAMASFLVKHDGIRTILTKPEALSDDQIREKWQANELRTKTFQDYRELIASKHVERYSDFEEVVDRFQQSRNKIMHLHFRFEEGDLYDLKYEATFMLVHIVSRFICEDDSDHPNNVANLLSREVFQKLIRFPPYQYHVEKIAREYSRVVLRCPMCDQKAFSDYELKCFSCGYEDPSIRLLTCEHCSERSVIYDHLNLDINKKLPTLCLICGKRQEVFKCTSCKGTTIGGPPYLRCELCAEDAQSQCLPG